MSDAQAFMKDYVNTMATHYKQSFNWPRYVCAGVKILKMPTHEQLNREAFDMYFRIGDMSNRPHLRVFRVLVNTWFANTRNKEEFVGIYDLLDGKIKAYLNGSKP